MRCEANYSAIEREAAAIIWAINHFSPYLEGSKFRIISDHAPLKWLLKKPVATGRLARWQMKLKQFTGLIGLEYKPGKDNANADTLSRISLPDDDFISAIGKEELITTDTLIRMQETDNECNKIQRMFTVGPDGIRRYKERLYLPAGLRIKTMRHFHGQEIGSHIGADKVHSQMVHYVYWPRMKEDISKFVQQCQPCKMAKTNDPPPAPLQSLPDVKCPFERIAMDFAGPFPASEEGHRYPAVVVDHFSRYVHAMSVKDESTQTAINVSYWRRLLIWKEHQSRS